MNPNVAIIISNYNYGPYVMSAIESALDQDYDGKIRVYVLDDGSSDDSWEKISSITDPIKEEEIQTPYYSGPIEKRVRDNVYAYKINNSGASTARNVAIWEAWEWADIFGILDADDTYKKQKTKILVEKLLEYEEVGVAYGDYEIHKFINGEPLYIKHELKTSYGREVLMSKCVVHSGSLIKKKYLQQIVIPTNSELFDSRLHGPGSKNFIGCTEDYDLWLRLSKVCMITHVPQILSTVRETGQNQSMKMTTEIFNNNKQILSESARE